ncbi:MAG: FeoA family protein [Oscillospiraceae bacterium]
MNYEPFPLSVLKQGKSAYINAVRCQDAMGRRLLDLGLIPGTKVTCVAVSPFGDPSAYLIRGAVLAVRDKDAVCVELVSARSHVGRVSGASPSSEAR